jgi:hypothetical protein
VAGGESADSVANLVDGLENPTLDGLLLQRSEQPFDDAIGFGLTSALGI